MRDEKHATGDSTAGDVNRQHNVSGKATLSTRAKREIERDHIEPELQDENAVMVSRDFTIAKAERLGMSLALNKRVMAWVQQYHQMMRSVYADWGQHRQSDSWTVWAKLAERFNMSPPDVANMPAPHVDGLIRAYTQNLEGPIADSTNQPKIDSMSPTQLAERLGCSVDTLSGYANKAGVMRPGRGQRNFKYSLESVTAILEHAKQNAGRSDIAANAERLLNPQQ